MGRLLPSGCVFCESPGVTHKSRNKGMRKNTSMALRGRMGISDLKQYLTKIAVLHHPSPQTHHPPKTTDSQCIRLVEPMKPDCVSALQRKRLESWPEELRARLSPARFESKNCGICGHFPQIPEQSRRVSLHFRLYGGAGGIRTLGTVSETSKSLYRGSCIHHRSAALGGTILRSPRVTCGGFKGP